MTAPAAPEVVTVAETHLKGGTQTDTRGPGHGGGGGGGGGGGWEEEVVVV